MMKFRERKELRDLIVKAFAKEPEVASIFFFGKEVENTTDEYSDIDIIICSNDLAATESKYLKIFNEISPVIGTYLLESTPIDMAQMIMLRDFSPYQKIDFSITDSIEMKISAGFSPLLSVYENNTPSPKIDSKFIGIKDSGVRNQLDDFLFSVPRFTKSLFRRDYDMYRRWKSISDILMVLLYEKYFGREQKTSKKKLPAKETCELYKLLNAREHEALKKIFPPDGNLIVADSYKSCFNLLVDLCQQKVCYFGVEMDSEFIQYISSFLDSEIERYRNVH